MASVGKLTKLGIVTVTTAGTEVKMFGAGPYKKISKIYVRALTANTGDMYIGDVNVDAATQVGIRLDSDQVYEISAGEGSNGGSLLLDVNNIYVDATVSGEKVSVTYYEVG